MPAPRTLLKAELREIEWDTQQVARETKPDKTVTVQFNPETLTVNFTNQSAGGDQRGGSAIQFVGQGTTKLSLDLWFDVTVADGQAPGRAQDDVRKLTERVNYFMKPEQRGSGNDVKWVVPGVRFIWGTFLFDGVMESLTEKLEFFSEDGKPLRSMLSVALNSQTIQFAFGEQAGAGAGPGTTTPGTQPRQPAIAGDTIQRAAARAGHGQDWRPMAQANNVENPRRLPPGTLLRT